MGRSPQVILDRGEVNAETPTGVSRRLGDSSAHFYMENQRDRAGHSDETRLPLIVF
jgi:hypothetical protein